MQELEGAAEVRVLSLKIIPTNFNLIPTDMLKIPTNLQLIPTVWNDPKKHTSVEIFY